MKNTRKLILSALFLALGYVLPFLTGQVPAVGKMLLPMHIPVLLCGFVKKWRVKVQEEEQPCSGWCWWRTPVILGVFGAPSTGPLHKYPW